MSKVAYNFSEMGIRVQAGMFLETYRDKWLSTMQEEFPDAGIESVPTWVAVAFDHCPRMKIFGYGFSFDEAMEDLKISIREIARRN